jgi:glycerol dehydrogenase-like iron-containing ADH family enzyme
MSMKKTDLEKNKMMKMSNLMKVAGIPDRFGKGAVVADRKEQRKLDQAAGLVPFACKLSSEMIKDLHEEAERQQTGMNELVAALLGKGLGK